MTADDKLSFEELITALETLTERMASGDIGIEEAAELYERAQVLHGLAAERLERVQQRIDSLTPPAQPDDEQKSKPGGGG